MRVQLAELIAGQEEIFLLPAEVVESLLVGMQGTALPAGVGNGHFFLLSCVVDLQW